jgi:hypothetical protein
MGSFRTLVRNPGVPFSAKLQATLHRQNLTPREASRVLQVTEHTIANWLTGESKSWGRVPNHLVQIGVLTVLKQRRVAQNHRPQPMIDAQSSGEALPY